MNIYVGNLAMDATEDDVRKAFEEFGPTSSVSIIKDKYTGESRGFGFVVMGDDEKAQAAIDGMNGKDLKGKPLRVNPAKTQGEQPGGRGGADRGGEGREPREARGGERW